MLKKIFILLSCLLLLMPSYLSAAVELWDFTDEADYSTSNDHIYFSDSDAKLGSTLGHVSHTENGSEAFDAVTNLVVDGNYAYVASYLGHAMSVLDISDPDNPVGVGYVGANGSARLYAASDIEKSGNYVYLASYTSDALEVIDVSNPASPFHAARLNNTSSTKLDGARGIHISGNYAYIASYRDDSLQIIDISNPLAPSAVGYVQDNTRLNGAMNVRVSGNYAYVTSYLGDSLQIIDISTPASPTLVGQVQNGVSGALLNGAWGLGISGSTVYVSSYVSDAIQAIDVTTPATPVVQDNIQNTSGVSLNGTKELKIIGTSLYVSATNSDGLQIINISNPNSLTATSRLTTTSTGRLDAITAIDVSSGFAVVSSYTNNTIEIIDVSTITTPTFRGQATSGPFRLGNATGIMIDGNYAYVTTYGSNSLQVIDISNTASPIAVGSISDLHTIHELRGAWDLEKKGNYIFISGYIDDGIEIIDVSTPSNPTHVALLNNTSGVYLNGVRSMDISGDFLYIAAYADHALQIIDISNPNSPVARGNIQDGTLLKSASDVEVVGNTAYVVNYARDSIAAIDVSDVDNPTFISELVNTSSNELNGAWNLVIDGDYAYISAYVDDAIQIVDISDPTNMIAKGFLANNANVKLNGPRGLIYDEGYIYTSVYSDDSVQVVDVSDVDNPISAGYFRHTDFLDTATFIDKKDGNIFLTTYYGSSFEILEEERYTDNPYVEPNNPISLVADIHEIREVLGDFHQGDIGYQFSKDDGSTWYYHDGSSWQTSGVNHLNSNTLSEFDTHKASFNALTGTELLVRAYFLSDGSEKVELDTIEVEFIDTTAPTISSSNIAADSILPGLSHTLEYSYSDLGGSGINTASGVLVVERYDAGTWGSIAGMSSISTTDTLATYSASFPQFGRYRAHFRISDNAGNISTIFQHQFYIDEPLLEVSHSEVDIGTLDYDTTQFGGTIEVKVQTIGAAFDVYLESEEVLTYDDTTIPFYDGSYGTGYDKNQDGSLFGIDRELIGSETASPNTLGELHTYTYQVDIGAIIPIETAAGNYEGYVNFDIDLEY